MALSIHRLALTLTTLTICTACNLPQHASEDASPRQQPPSSVEAAAAAPANRVSIANTVVNGVASAKPTIKPSSDAKPSSDLKQLQQTSTLQLKRLVVASGVKDREPLASADALSSDGTPIYAFAELANPVGGSENVRITFERKGGAERVGDVTLPVPGGVPRHRTWAFTRSIRVPGVWEAVLWSESGTELGRTSFEVKQS